MNDSVRTETRRTPTPRSSIASHLSPRYIFFTHSQSSSTSSPGKATRIPAGLFIKPTRVKHKLSSGRFHPKCVRFYKPESNFLLSKPLAAIRSPVTVVGVYFITPDAEPHRECVLEKKKKEKKKRKKKRERKEKMTRKARKRKKENPRPTKE